MPHVPRDRCHRCGAEMEPGFLIDRQDTLRYRLPTWVAGFPEPSVLTGIATRGRTQRVVQAWRCTGCGLLELYALGEV